MDRSPEHNDSGTTAGIATLANSGYTFSRLGLVPCDLDDPNPQPAEPVATVPSPAPAPVPTPPPAVHVDSSTAPKPAWRETPTVQPAAATEPAAKVGEEDFVRVTVKVPRALRDILRSCAKNTHRYQYVLVIEALAEFLVQLPEDMQRQLLRDVNGETIKMHDKPDVPPSTWKRMWKRWFGA